MIGAPRADRRASGEDFYPGPEAPDADGEVALRVRLVLAGPDDAVLRVLGAVRLQQGRLIGLRLEHTGAAAGLTLEASLPDLVRSQRLLSKLRQLSDVLETRVESPPEADRR